MPRPDRVRRLNRGLEHLQASIDELAGVVQQDPPQLAAESLELLLIELRLVARRMELIIAWS